MKHFNMGNVWGRVAKVELEHSEGKGTPYLSIQVECGNELYGNVKTYGRLWGQKEDMSKIDAFMDYYKKNPGSAYRFKGFFSQYDKDENRRYSNYTFFAWEAVNGKEYRAAFILVGEVTAIEKETPQGQQTAETAIHLHLVREGQGSYKDNEEDFVVYAFTPRELDGIEDGDTIECAGLLRAREPEDDFGRQTGRIMPFAMEIKKRQNQDAPGEDEAGSRW